jgi:integrase/recombinase XerD
MNASHKPIAEEYTMWLGTLGYSDSIIYSCKTLVQVFLEWLEEKQVQNISQLAKGHISEYYHYLETRPNKVFKNRLLSVAHLNKNYFAIDKLLEFLHQYGMDDIPLPAGKRIQMDEQERIHKIETLSQQEIKKLYDCIPQTYPSYPFKERQAKQYELKLVFALYYGCGLRLSEGYRLQLQDIDLDKKTVFIRQGKNYKDRIVPMSAGVYKELQDYIYNFRHSLKLKHNRLFISDKQVMRLRLKYLQRICPDETIKAKRITLHLLRHSIATHLLQNGMSIENISLFLGHSSLDSTQIYTHLI